MAKGTILSYSLPAAHYIRIQQRELKRKNLSLEATARLLTEHASYKDGHSLWNKRKNLENRLKKLKEAGVEDDYTNPPIRDDAQPRIPNIQVSQAVESSSGNSRHTHMADISGEKEAGEEEAGEVESGHDTDCICYCLFCYTNHSIQLGNKLDDRSPYLIQSQMARQCQRKEFY